MHIKKYGNQYMYSNPRLLYFNTGLRAKDCVDSWDLQILSLYIIYHDN